MAGLKAVLFDGGNTLLELDYPWLAALARRLGAEGATEEEIGLAGASLLRRSGLRYATTPAPQEASSLVQESFAAIGSAIGLEPVAAAEFARRVQREDDEHPQGLWRCAAPEARDMLGELKARDLLLGVISNSDGRAAHHLDLAGLGTFLDLVIDSSHVGIEKPNPAIFRLALAQFGLASYEAAYVGDLLDVDVAGARRAGLRPVLYDRFGAYADVPDLRIRSLGELTQFL